MSTVDAGLTEGERWAHEQLRLLHDEHFSPRGIMVFLGASRRRAADARAARPALTRQARAWTAAGALAWLAFGAVGSRQVDRRARLGLGWWAACALMLDWHVGMVQTEDGRSRPLGAADAMTLTRAWLVPLAWDRPTATLCAIAGLTDALDGALARQSEPTRAGRDFDGVVDACFGAAALHGARRHDLVGRWLAQAELTRISVGVGYGVVSYFRGLARPDRVVTDAARRLAPLRLAGLLALAAGRRRLGSAVLGAGVAGSVLAHAVGALPKLGSKTLKSPVRTRAAVRTPQASSA